jgi:guanylate kinase
MKLDNLAPLCPPPKPLLIVLSGLSGAGKDTVLDGLRKSDLPFYFSVSATTRARRPNEKEGYDYYFISKKKFQEMIDADELIEWANVYGNLYGRPKEPIRQALQKGRDVIVRIDVQGSVTYKKLLPQAVFVFMVTSTLAELEQRLRKRQTETPAELALRLDTAQDELAQMPMFDYVIENRENKVEVAVNGIKSIMIAEKCRVVPREINI